MNSKTTTFLVVALLACTGYVAIWHGDFFLPPNPDGGTSDQSAVFSEGPGNLVELTVDDLQTGSQVKFQADSGHWRIVKPFRATAIGKRIAKLIEPLTSIRCVQRFAEGGPGAPTSHSAGLDRPRWRVRFIDDRQKTYGLDVGAPVPLSGETRTYVRTQGNKQILVVDANLTAALSRRADYYRSRRVMEIPAEAIMSIHLAGAETFSIVRKPQGKWSILQDSDPGTPAVREVRADAGVVAKFLKAFAAIDAEEFIDNPTDLASYGLSEGSKLLEITLRCVSVGTSDLKEHTVLLGSKAGGATGRKVFARLIAPDRTIVFTLPASMLERLQVDSLDLRDKAVMPVAADAVLKIELTVESESMTLTRSNDEWRIIAPVSADANQQRVRLVLDRIAGMHATSFRHEKTTDVEFGFDQPRGVIRLFQAGVGEPPTLEIGAESPTGAVVFVRSSATDAIAAVPARETGPLLAPTACYYDPVLWRLDAGAEVGRIVMKRPDGTFELAKTGDKDSPWRLAKPLEARTDNANINNILDRLDNLTATRIVSVGTKTRAYYARGQGATSVTFTVRPVDSPTTRPVEAKHTFGMSILEGKVYGWMEGDPLGRVGLFTRGLYGQFAAELRRRQVVGFDPKTIDGIVITLGKTSTTLRRFGGGWKYPEDADLPIDPGKVATFLADAAAVKALRFVAHDKKDAGSYGLGVSKAWLVVELAAKDDRKIRISVSPRGSDGSKNRYAMADSVEGVFTISAETAAKLARELPDFKK